MPLKEHNVGVGQDLGEDGRLGSSRKTGTGLKGSSIVLRVTQAGFHGKGPT